jgi:hypothetical protein
MHITELPTIFANACMDTPIGAICLKKRGESLRELLDDEYGHGRLVRPGIVTGSVKNEDEFNAALKRLIGSNDTVIVRGHGWPMERKFVWTGTLDEFNETWEVD